MICHLSTNAKRGNWKCLKFQSLFMAIISGGWLSTIAMLSSGQNGIHIQCSSWIITLFCNGSLLQGIFVSLYELNMVRFPCSRSIFKEDVIYTSVNFLYELGLYSSECVGRWDLIGCFLVYWLDLVSTLVYWTTGSGGLRCLASVNPSPHCCCCCDPAPQSRWQQRRWDWCWW